MAGQATSVWTHHASPWVGWVWGGDFKLHLTKFAMIRASAGFFNRKNHTLYTHWAALARVISVRRAAVATNIVPVSAGGRQCCRLASCCGLPVADVSFWGSLANGQIVMRSHAPPEQACQSVHRILAILLLSCTNDGLAKNNSQSCRQ